VSSAAKPEPGRELVISVAMGRWAVAAAPSRIVTLLGSCVGVILFERVLKLGAVAHIMLPNSRGSTDHTGKFADTAIPAMLAELKQMAPPGSACRPIAKLLGGANMFPTTVTGNAAGAIGQANGDAAASILAALNIPVVARDLGGESGRRVALAVASGVVAVRTPAGREYEI
jgi:chemotaxis protein CheD